MVNPPRRHRCPVSQFLADRGVRLIDDDPCFQPAARAVDSRSSSGAISGARLGCVRRRPKPRAPDAAAGARGDPGSPLRRRL